jgi:hypothetical protein
MFYLCSEVDMHVMILYHLLACTNDTRSTSCRYFANTFAYQPGRDDVWDITWSCSVWHFVGNITDPRTVIKRWWCNCEHWAARVQECHTRIIDLWMCHASVAVCYGMSMGCVCAHFALVSNYRRDSRLKKLKHMTPLGATCTCNRPLACRRSLGNQLFAWVCSSSGQ